MTKFVQKLTLISFFYIANAIFVVRKTTSCWMYRSPDHLLGLHPWTYPLGDGPPDLLCLESKKCLKLNYA